MSFDAFSRSTVSEQLTLLSLECIFFWQNRDNLAEKL